MEFDDEPGYIYLLLEHKSYPDRFIHLQLLGYFCRIWKLYMKQTGSKRLPAIVPLVLYHGKTAWLADVDFASLIAGPNEKLKTYIPDFRFVLYDLTQFSDGQIKGTLLSRIVLLLLKHISDPDFMEKLPGIMALFNDLSDEESGLRNLETVLRYLFSTVENMTPEKMKTVIEHSISGVRGDIVMTLVEKWISEGYQKGIQQGVQQGIQQGLIEGIVPAVRLKFGAGPESDKLIEVIQNVKEIKRLKALKDAILKASTVTDLIRMLTG